MRSRIRKKRAKRLKRALLIEMSHACDVCAARDPAAAFALEHVFEAYAVALQRLPFDRSPGTSLREAREVSAEMLGF